MLRVESRDELVADRLWAEGAVAITEADDFLLAGFATSDDERRAAAAMVTIGITASSEVADERWDDISLAGPRELTFAGATITIDPDGAFGLGNHPSTRLALRALVDYGVADRSVLDVGTGTGILAVAAARMGATRVLAVDIDEHAVAVARKNARENGVAAVVQVELGAIDAATPVFDVTIANLGGLLTPLAMAPALAARTTHTIVISGLLDERAGGLPAAPLDASLRDHGFELAEIAGLDVWMARTYER